jgi:hypothetical protein
MVDPWTQEMQDFSYSQRSTALVSGASLNTEHS